MTKKVKVLHVGFGGRGGAARVLVDIAKHHSPEFQINVILLGYGIDKGYISELAEAGIPCISVIKQSRFDLSFLSKLKRSISGINPDVVLLHTPVAYIWGRLLFVLKRQRPIIISAEHSASAGYQTFGALLNRALSFRSDKIICVSEAVKEHLVGKHFPNAKICV